MPDNKSKVKSQRSKLQVKIKQSLRSDDLKQSLLFSKAKGQRFFFQWNGFSLIELMLALGLMALVTAVAIPNLRLFSSTQDVELAVLNLETTLRQAQSSAASGVQCPTGEYSQGWQVNLDLSGTPDQYEVVVNCQTSGGTTVSRTVSTSNFSKGPDANQLFSATTDRCGDNINVIILFSGKQMTYQCAGESFVSSPELTITVSSSQASKNLIVEPGGVIRVE